MGVVIVVGSNTVSVDKFRTKDRRALRKILFRNCVVDIANDIQKSSKTTFTRGGVVNALMAEYDVIQQLATVLDDAPSHLQVIHIKAHQDNEIPREALSIPAKLNVMADELATAALRGNTSTTKANLIPGVKVLVHTTKGTVT